MILSVFYVNDLVPSALSVTRMHVHRSYIIFIFTVCIACKLNAFQQCFSDSGVVQNHWRLWDGQWLILPSLHRPSVPAAGSLFRFQSCALVFSSHLGFPFCCFHCWDGALVCIKHYIQSYTPFNKQDMFRIWICSSRLWLVKKRDMRRFMCGRLGYKLYRYMV